MKSFDEWWKVVSGGKHLPENRSIGIAYKAGAQSQQQKIDELQKRIDEALIVIDNLSWASESDVIKIKEILKGEPK